VEAGKRRITVENFVFSGIETVSTTSVLWGKQENHGFTPQNKQETGKQLRAKKAQSLPIVDIL
jgi:hypothetical protein